MEMLTIKNYLKLLNQFEVEQMVKSFSLDIDEIQTAAIIQDLQKDIIDSKNIFESILEHQNNLDSDHLRTKHHEIAQQSGYDLNTVKKALKQFIEMKKLLHSSKPTPPDNTPQSIMQQWLSA